MAEIGEFGSTSVVEETQWRRSETGKGRREGRNWNMVIMEKTQKSPKLQKQWSLSPPPKSEENYNKKLKERKKKEAEERERDEVDGLLEFKEGRRGWGKRHWWVSMKEEDGGDMATVEAMAAMSTVEARKRGVAMVEGKSWRRLGGRE